MDVSFKCIGNLTGNWGAYVAPVHGHLFPCSGEVPHELLLFFLWNLGFDSVTYLCILISNFFLFPYCLLLGEIVTVGKVWHWSQKILM